MLHTITIITEDLKTLILDDPVRPEIPLSDRVNVNSRMYVLKNGDQTQAVTCVKFLSAIPAAVEDMAVLVESATIAVFYTIWSYAAGAGQCVELALTRPIDIYFSSNATSAFASWITDVNLFTIY